MRVSRVTLRGVAGLPDLQIEPADGLVALAAADRGLRLKLEEVLWNAILTGGRTRDAEGARIEVETVPALQDTALRTRSWVDLWRDMTVSTPEGVLLAAAELLGKVGATARLARAMAMLDGARTAVERDRAPPAARATRPGRRAALGNELRSSERELRALRADHAEASGDLEETTMEWLRERQDAETHLLAYRDRARELKGRLSHLEASGADAPCPTCGRVLEEHVAEVVRRLREEWETVVQDGSWWKRRREQLELKPSGIAIWRDGCCGCTQPWRPARKGSSSWGRRSADVLHRGLEWLRARAGGTEGRDLSGSRRGASLEAGSQPEGARIVREAMAEVGAELQERADQQILDLASADLRRLSHGQVLKIERTAEGGIVLHGPTGPVPPVSAPLRASAMLALRLAATRRAVEATDADLGPIIVAGSFDDLERDSMGAALQLMRETAQTHGQVLLLGRVAAVEAASELFESVHELSSEQGGDGWTVRPLPSGPGRLRLRS